jgi:ribosome-associated protein
MDIRKLQRAIVDGLEDVKAQDIRVFNTEHLSPLFERVIVATGASNRQTKALSSSVRDAVRSAGLPVLATEGAQNGEWIIVDCGAAVAHIMQPDIRDYYRLEEIWGGKQVKMKLGDGAGKGLVKASEPEDDEPVARRKAAVKAVAKAVAKAAAKKSSVGKGSTGKPSAGKVSAGKASAAHPAATHAPSRGTASTRKTAAGKPARPAAKAPAARKVAPAKAASRRPAPRTPPLGKATGRPAGGKPSPRKPAARRG